MNIYKTCNQPISVPLKQIMTCWLEPVCQLLVKQSLNLHQSFLSAIQQTFQLLHQDPTVYYHLHFATKDNICSFIHLWVKKKKIQVKKDEMWANAHLWYSAYMFNVYKKPTKSANRK